MNQIIIIIIIYYKVWKNYIYDSKININFSSLVKRKKLGFNDISILEKCNGCSPIFSKRTLKEINIQFRFILNKYITEIKNINNISFCFFLIFS